MRNVEQRLARIAHRITPRDLHILTAIAHLRVLTPLQVERLFFSSGLRTRVRLVALHRLGLLERFRTSSRGAYHYLLSELGAARLAQWPHAPSGVDERPSADALISAWPSGRRGRLLWAADIGCDLVAWERATPEVRLTRWMGGWEVKRSFDRFEPHAHFVIESEGRSVELFVDCHRSWLDPEALAWRLEHYTSVEWLRGVVAWVIVPCRTERQEGDWRRAARACAEVPVATAFMAPGVGAQEPIWRPLFGVEEPVRLVDLALAEVPETSKENVCSGGHPWRYPLDDRGRWWDAR